MIEDRLNLQGNTIKLLKEGLTLFLETEKKLRLKVELTEEELKKEKKI